MREFFYVLMLCTGAVVQAPFGAVTDPLTRVSTLITITIALASATVMVFKLGGQQQHMQNLTQNVDAALRRYREELDRFFARFETVLASIDQFVRATTEHRIAIERWQAQIDALYGTIDARVARLEQTESREAA